MADLADTLLDSYLIFLFSDRKILRGKVFPLSSVLVYSSQILRLDPLVGLTTTFDS